MTATASVSTPTPTAPRAKPAPRAARTYQGHKNWSYWNVSLWINNDEGLYWLARDYADRLPRRAAARAMVDDLASLGYTKTPDGARYSVGAVQAAMRDM